MSKEKNVWDEIRKQMVQDGRLRSCSTGPYLTTGQLAKVFHVAPRTVGKWIDKGRMKAHRIPDSNDRRVHVQEVIDFAIREKFPIDPGLSIGKTVIAYGLPEREVEKFECLPCGSDFEFGAALGACEVIRTVVLGDEFGTEKMVQAAKLVRGKPHTCYRLRLEERELGSRGSVPRQFATLIGVVSDDIDPEPLSKLLFDTTDIFGKDTKRKLFSAVVHGPVSWELLYDNPEFPFSRPARRTEELKKETA